MTATEPCPEVGVRVREATRADLLEVFNIERESFSQPWPYAAFERFLGSSGFLVAVDDRVVGYAVADTVHGHGVSVGHIKDIAVAPDRRGEGVGRTLLSRAMARLYGEGARRVKLEVRESNAAAKSLYEEFDFELHHVVPGYYDDGEDAHVMMRDG